MTINNDWISVKDEFPEKRLPDGKDNYVLVNWGYDWVDLSSGHSVLKIIRHVELAYFDGLMWRGKNWRGGIPSCRIDTNLAPTHWMPIPDLPEEQK
jgi:hypothetical protein